LSSYLIQNKDSADVRKGLELTQATNVDQLVEVLKQWIIEDRKHPALKLIQGLIWEQGYINKEIFGQIYSDVLPAFNIWKSKDIQFGIYSSGSVLAQKLLFKHTDSGDLTPYLSFHFDTAIGFKKEKQSYHQIALELKLNPSDILFASDIADELAAAKLAGFQVVQVVRPGTMADSRFDIRPNLLEISL
jgi:enolase-phosphatase E1